MGNGEFTAYRLIGRSSADTDLDGIFDYLDLDSDNDGITDNVEAQSTANYIAPSGLGGTGAFTDANRDGLDDNYDDAQGADGQNADGSYTHTGTGLTPVNTGGDSAPDYIDLDSDGDGVSDADEAGHGQGQQTGISDSSTDTDGDGLFDAVDEIAGFDVNDQDRDAGSASFTDSDIDVTTFGITNSDPLNIDHDWREALDTCLLYTSPSPRDRG